MQEEGFIPRKPGVTWKGPTELNAKSNKVNWTLSSTMLLDQNVPHFRQSDVSFCLRSPRWICGGQAEVGRFSRVLGFMPTVHQMSEHWATFEWNLTQEIWKTREENLSTTTSSITCPTWTILGANPDLHCEKLLTVLWHYYSKEVT
jgi:hypothetical protein